ncbi:MAG: hypothetical protein M1839_002248 [Geoglossum umbratile]|nr:MAG: hypothetical protein M1839_002248 [Geoglossum umbratile]
MLDSTVSEPSGELSSLVVAKPGPSNVLPLQPNADYAMTISQPTKRGLVDVYSTVVHYGGDSNRRQYDGAKTRVGAAVAARAAPGSGARYNIKITPRDEKPKADDGAVVERFELVFRRPAKPLLAKQQNKGMKP